MSVPWVLCSEPRMRIFKPGTHSAVCAVTSNILHGSAMQWQDSFCNCSKTIRTDQQLGSSPGLPHSRFPCHDVAAMLLLPCLISGLPDPCRMCASTACSWRQCMLACSNQPKKKLTVCGVFLELTKSPSSTKYFATFVSALPW